MQRSVSRNDFRMAANLMRSPAQYPQPKGYAVPEIDFGVCEKYEIREGSIVAGFGGENSDRWRWISPLDEAPDLFLTFSRLHRERDFPRAALRFTQQYGLPHDEKALEGAPATLTSERLPLVYLFIESQRA